MPDFVDMWLEAMNKMGEQALAERKKKREAVVDFCISKCGEGYCPAMKGQDGYPCLGFICAFCEKPHDEKYCQFCRGVS